MTPPHVAIVLALSLGMGCGGKKSRRDERTDTANAAARGEAPAVDKLASDAAIRQQVLRMTFAEAQARLGSFRYQAKVQHSFNRGNAASEQDDTVEIAWDATGNFRVVNETSSHRVELTQIAGDVFVRQDRGQVRKKPRRDVDTSTWCETGYASQRDTFDLFAERLAFTEPRPGKLDGREALRYRITLLATPSEPATPQPNVAALPVAPPAKWRELAQPLDGKGELWVDVATGVVLQASLRGRLQIADREVRPTELVLSYEGRLTDIGSVEPLTPPEAVAEYARVPPPRDLLDFFRDKLPKPVTATEPTAATTGTVAPSPAPRAE